MLEVGELAFGHTRLAILDLEPRADQPQWSSDGSVLLNYNGEIYNFRRLGVGEEASDTVALAQWLAREGSDFDPSALDGMYAFAAWFPAGRKLVLARDPVGIKPLYIALSEDGAHLAFCSEIKGFFGVEWFTARPNRDAVVQREFLQYGRAFPRPVELCFRGMPAALPLVPTLLAGVWQVSPGQCLTFSLEAPPSARAVRLLARGADDVAEALADSVADQSVADVEVGVQLSGGIDSSLTAHEFARTHSRVHGFHLSVDFKKHNEEKWARQAADVIAKRCDFQFHVIPLTPEEVRRVLPAVIWHSDEPPMRHRNIVGPYLLAEHARCTGVKVLLAGEGADEVFAGYDWHDGRTVEGFDRTRRLFDLGGSDRVARFFPASAGRGDILRCQLAYDRAIYLPMLLAHQDRMSMAHSIETRVPFLSNRFLTMPTPARPGKVALKELAAGLFGRKFARRPKYGSPMPRRWFAWLPVQREHLDWLVEPWEPQTKNESWALACLSAWSAMYLHGGWKNQPALGPPRRP